MASEVCCLAEGRTVTLMLSGMSRMRGLLYPQFSVSWLLATEARKPVPTISIRLVKPSAAPMIMLAASALTIVSGL